MKDCLNITVFLSKEYGLFFLDFKVEIVIFSQNYEEKEVHSIIAVDMRMTFVLSGGNWIEVLGSGGVYG
jgi:hypothetical protein